MSAELFLQIFGQMIVLVGLVAGAFKSLMTRMDTQNKELEGRTDAQITALHERVNSVKDEYVKRVDLDRDLNSLRDLILSIKQDTHQVMSSIKDDNHRQMEQINQRLDQLAISVANCGSD